MTNPVASTVRAAHSAARAHRARNGRASPCNSARRPSQAPARNRICQAKGLNWMRPPGCKLGIASPNAQTAA